LKYAAVDGTLSIFNRNIANEDEHWVVSYQPTFAMLTVAPGNVQVLDQGSTLLLLALGFARFGNVSAAVAPWTALSIVRVITGNHC
jgi:hypothetical protein